MAGLCCHRCGDLLIERSSTLEASGDLRNFLRGPLVICRDCADRFRDWLRGGRGGALAELPRPQPPRPAVKRSSPGLSCTPATPAAIA
jgi:hypothetical protein